ncbi:hypothetical protein [Streptomyces sp. NPDC088725]|uniref:DUF7224 domain-containing protein n=1 Tax=Streptomyces sp. NPDC088725 TaxID=3365873 RepID=UPI00380B1257
MRVRTGLRVSSAKWAAPVAVALSLLYYYGSGVGSQSFGYSPSIVSSALGTLYAAAYALTAALAVWESGRLKAAGVWAMAPVRSRYRVAWNGVAPVVFCGWILLLLPVAIALGSARAVPTPASTAPLAMAMILCVAHAVVGFAVGLLVPRTVAAPVVAAVIWVLVAFSWSTDAFWVRHVSGQYPTSLMFGELATYGSFVPHLLFAGGIAAGIALLWVPLRPKVVRAALALAVMVGCPALAYQEVKSWGPNPPVLLGQAPMNCAGESPKVCLPQASPARATAVRKEAASVLDDLRSAGFPGSPRVIIDRLGDGRYPPPSSQDTWRVGLTDAVRRGDLRYELTRASVQFPCLRVDPFRGNSVMLWAATVTGEEATYNAHMKMRDEPFRREAEVRGAVRRILAAGPAEQGDWYRRNIAAGCRQSS